jgi:dTDP-glucose 4,6-dehydratase
MMKNILVTGGAGFIGSNFVRYLLDQAASGAAPELRIINLDILSYAGSLENLKDLPAPEHHTFIQGDICDRSLVDSLFQTYQIDTVVHFAAETHVDRSIHDPEPFIRANIIGTFTLLDVARKYWVSSPAGLSTGLHNFRFHHVSTDEVFGSLAPDAPAWSEATPYDPHSPYSATKASSDHLVRAYGHTYGLPVTISNCSNNYGPYQFPEKLIPLMILNALNGRQLPVYGDGQQIRDWLYVVDHCSAIWSVLRDGKPGETYTIGGGNQPSNLVVVRMICDILDECKPDSPFTPHEQLIHFAADRPGHDRRYAMDITRIRQELGWQPRYSLEDGLLKTAEWYLSHPEWIDNIRERKEYQSWLDRNYAQRSS